MLVHFGLRHDLGSVSFIPAASAFAFSLSTIHSGVWILIGETFPTRTRARQAALSTASNWLWNFLLAFFTPFIVKSIKYRYGFVFAACNLTGAVIVYLFLYESSDLSLEEVDEMYCDPACKPWTSRRGAPEGFSSRKELVEQSRAAEAHKPLEAGAGEESRHEHAVTDEKAAHAV